MDVLNESIEQIVNHCTEHRLPFIISIQTDNNEILHSHGVFHDKTPDNFYLAIQCIEEGKPGVVVINKRNSYQQDVDRFAELLIQTLDNIDMLESNSCESERIRELHKNIRQELMRIGRI